MRWKANCYDEEEWHKWFAWYPVLTEFSEWVWLEHVHRRQVGWYEPSWIYKVL